MGFRVGRERVRIRETRGVWLTGNEGIKKTEINHELDESHEWTDMDGMDRMDGRDGEAGRTEKKQ